MINTNANGRLTMPVRARRLGASAPFGDLSLKKCGVSFLIPVYNGSAYLTSAVDSIRRQTDPDWRLLLIDDASTDDSRRLMDSYADSRISPVHNDRNMGLYPSLLKGIDLVESEWVAILMQDDRLKPWYLEEMRRLMRTYPDVGVFWATEDTIGEDGRLLRAGLDTARTERIAPGCLPWKSALRRGCIWTISGSMTSRELLEDIPFREDLCHCSDYDWLLRAIRVTPFVYYERPLVELRLHAAQASATNLMLGRDLEESYGILAQNFRRHADELRVREVVTMCARRSRNIARRAVAALVRGRPESAMHLARHLWRFLRLPFVYRWSER